MRLANDSLFGHNMTQHMLTVSRVSKSGTLPLSINLLDLGFAFGEKELSAKGQRGSQKNPEVALA